MSAQDNDVYLPLFGNSPDANINAAGIAPVDKTLSVELDEILELANAGVE